MIKRSANVKKKDWQLGRNIQKIRQLKRVTQEELAEKIGTSTPWIGHIETGRAVPNIKMLQKIAHALNIKVKDLIPF